MRLAINQFEERRTKEKGIVAVEMALILPLFALLLLGTFEIGLIARDHQVLQNAAREGARFSALPANRMASAQNPGTVLLTIQNRIIAYLANEHITVTPGAIGVNQSYVMNIAGLTVQGSFITITYQRPLIFPGVTSLIPLGSLQLQGSAVFRNLY
jgi:hypothetical protein